MRYTQSQVRDLLGISVDAFRVWREAIPALAVHKGHAPTFTVGDIVALAALAALVRDFGIRVNSLSGPFDEMLRACRGMSWQSLRNSVLIVTSSTFFLVRQDHPQHHTSQEPAIYISCTPIVDHLQAALTSTEPYQPQGHLPLPPTAVG